MKSIMKKQQVIVTDRSGIPAAAELAERVAERAAAEKPGRTEDRVCPLVCEELILRMLSAGCAKVTVTARGRRFRYVEISGAGEPADPAAEKNAEGDLGTQISGCILEQYADSYDHRYRGGVHVYRVFAGQRNTLDLSAVPIVKKLTHLPVIVDPSHATGKSWLVEQMSLAAVAAGADGLMIEVHNDPKHALSDGAQSLTPDQFDRVAAKAFALKKAYDEIEKKIL